MNINKMVHSIVQYFTEAFARIFGPSTDEYPEVGVQPFGGDPHVGNAEER